MSMIGRIISRICRRLNHLYLRYWKYKRKGVHFGNHSTFNNSILGDYVNLAHHAAVSNSIIGSRTSIGRYSKIHYAEIGKYCSISWDVTIGAMDHPLHSVTMHAFSWQNKFGLQKGKPTSIPHREMLYIGNDVWIGCGVVIMPGVRIGDGAVIGAGAVVTHDVQPYEIVAGVPAKHIRWRFDEEVRTKLLSIKWWGWDDKTIQENIGLFSPDVDLTIQPELLERLESISH